MEFYEVLEIEIFNVVRWTEQAEITYKHLGFPKGFHWMIPLRQLYNISSRIYRIVLVYKISSTKCGSKKEEEKRGRESLIELLP